MEQTEYTAEQVARMPEPSCPRCGGPARQAWINVRKLRDTEDRFIRGRVHCQTPGAHS
jgi:hypothetical protein